MQAQRSSFKTSAVELALSALRGYIRFSPVDMGKPYLWTRCFDRYFDWRTTLRPRVIRTRFGFSLGVKLPDTIQKVVLLTGRWEPFVTRFVLDTLHSGDTFIDVGANIGYYALLASRRVGANGRVYAIEGSPSIFQRLSENVTRNNVANTTMIHAIVSDTEGTKPFWLAAEPHSGCSTSVESAAAHHPWLRASHMSVEAHVASSPLINLVPTESLFNARLIKVDVEGAESEVLRPLIPLLGQFAPRTAWMLELSPQLSPGGQADIDWIYHSFCNAGYQAFALPNAYSVGGYLARVSSAGLQTISGPPTTQVDVVFLRQ
jgi:FkbM family methyltransferase